ncbi:hypothetical protein [Sorangium sp. So ce590]|uniref:hypothetical protein n=1 Tax=unclassified Sorangium TaxID=2621164 RepID=UPI003F6196AC
MSLADLLLIALFLLFALVSWFGAALGRRRESPGERRQDGEASPRAPLHRGPAARPGHAAPQSVGPLLSGQTEASPAGGSVAGAGRAAVRRRAPLASALRHRASLRRTFALMAVLDRRADRGG